MLLNLYQKPDLTAIVGGSSLWHTSVGTFWGWLITSSYEPVSKRTGSNGRIRVVYMGSFQLSNIKQHESEGRLAQSAERKAKNLEVVGSNLGFLHLWTVLSRKETRIRYRVRVILITLR